MNPYSKVIVFPGHKIAIKILRRDIQTFEQWQNTPDKNERYEAIRVAVMVNKLRASQN